ncbi:MAG: putative acetyltransferase [Gemmatimonadetes bacterium]|nr:putative acetyltransferase [Gemmatimonadota bacterium]
MRLVRHHDAADFLRATGTHLGAAEIEHSLILGATLGLRDGPSSAPSPAPYLASVWDGDALVMAALHRPPQPLVLADVRTDASGAAAALMARDLQAADQAPAHVLASVEAAAAFAAAWCRAAGCRAMVAMRQRLHALTQVEVVRCAAGAMRRAGPADEAVVGAWAWAFAQEAIGEASEGESRATAERRIAAGEVWLWDDGEPRAMAATTRPTPGGIAINSVYTPPAGRGRGHATALVAALSRRMLADGRRFCVLFTDLANPTSNAIYARIGYRPVRDFTLYRFVPTEPGE